MIAIIDYKMGNLQSVQNALSYIGAETFVARKPEQLSGADKIVLPGVGAFADGINNLRQSGFIKALEDEVLQKRKPFLGICLGMQLLATTGTEHCLSEGLNWIKGKVERIPNNNSLRIPHIGWNDVKFSNNSGLYKSLNENTSFYFVHSYIFRPEDSSVITGVCSYGVEFAASLEFQNIWATQFHPEKSHKAGLKILSNFVELKNK